MFDEKQRLPLTLVAALLALTLGLPLLVALLAGGADFPEALLGSGAGAVVVVLLCGLRARVRIVEEGLRLSLPPFYRKVLPYAGIAHARAVERINPLRDAGGWGLRWRGGGNLALVMRSGPGVRIATASGASYLIGASDPRGLLKALRARGVEVHGDPAPGAD
ncbi:hypothetical protein [Streptomyces boluensis]|uniref:Uncharacterized protein n=1 Tax=Streptomyces boluensis TaxID=1775135 RepID=A0A964UZ92_9ACTN|nr:hypothetical protein [Streptomyces boluensis]NBE56960.1 hypothetical protein [Streptomyces boluensis]